MVVNRKSEAITAALEGFNCVSSWVCTDLYQSSPNGFNLGLRSTIVNHIYGFVSLMHPYNVIEGFCISVKENMRNEHEIAREILMSGLLIFLRKNIHLL